jgi:NTP pyrophosphatase (non-canonical NTP hydrolase)
MPRPDYTPLIGEFGARMEKKLRKNEHKPGWNAADVLWMLAKLQEECGELATAILKEHPLDDVLDECADVGNLAMIIFDLAKQQHPQADAERTKGD